MHANKTNHKKEATRFNPIGVLQVNNKFVWNKGLKRGGVDDHKHSLLNCNGKNYNGIDNAHICSNLAQSPTTKINQKKTNKFRCCLFKMHSKFHGSIYPPETCLTNNKTINAKSSNEQIIKYTMEGDFSYLCYPV